MKKTKNFNFFYDRSTMGFNHYCSIKFSYYYWYFQKYERRLRQNNIRIIVITIVCVFATFLALLKEQGITPAIGILGSVAGYIFGLKDNPKE